MREPRTAVHKRTSFPGLEELFTVANVAIDYLVNHSSKDISDVTIAFLGLENVDFYSICHTYDISEKRY